MGDKESSCSPADEEELKKQGALEKGKTSQSGNNTDLEKDESATSKEGEKSVTERVGEMTGNKKEKAKLEEEERDGEPMSAKPEGKKEELASGVEIKTEHDLLKVTRGEPADQVASKEVKQNQPASGGIKKNEPASTVSEKNEPCHTPEQTAKKDESAKSFIEESREPRLKKETLESNLLATPTPYTKLPRGATFFKEISRQAILQIEYEDPFETITLFHLIGVERRPLTLADVPVDYRPYKGCIFDALSSPDDDQRFADFKKFFKELATEGHPSRTCGLMFTVMQCWRTIYKLMMSVPSEPADQASYHYFVRAGMYESFIRILGYCLDKKFLAIEYNRYVPYRILELFFFASQLEQEEYSYMVEKLIKESESVLSTFTAIATGGITCVEQLACCQVLGNMACFTPGVLWLIEHPKVVGIIGKQLWSSYDVMYLKFRQCEDRRIDYHKHLCYTEVKLGKREDNTESKYTPTPIRIADLTTFVSLCCLVNICAAVPGDTTMEKIEPCLVEVVKHGLYWYIGDVAYGIILNDSQYTTDLTIDRFLSFISWSCFQKESQDILMDMIKSLPCGQQDEPLLYFSRTSMTRSRTVVAFLITHALWLDYDKGSHYSMLGLISLLQENTEYAMEVIEMIGDLLFDLGHSIHHVLMPSNSNPLSVKRAIFEPFLKFGGYTYFDVESHKSELCDTQFDEDKHPQCIKDVRAFCERYSKESLMKKIDKEKQVRAADAFKMEGNGFFMQGHHESAIICYTKALETCPLSCTERRVTYHSNRAECYLKTHQLCKAVRDCNKALSMNPRNMKARWRRAQALQSLNKPYPAALDLLTIQNREVEAKQILGDKLYWELDEMIYRLMDGGNFLELTAMKNGPTIYQGIITRSYATGVDGVTDKTTLPPFRGQHYHDIFGLGKGNYTD